MAARLRETKVPARCTRAVPLQTGARRLRYRGVYLNAGAGDDSHSGQCLPTVELRT